MQLRPVARWFVLSAILGMRPLAAQTPTPAPADLGRVAQVQLQVPDGAQATSDFDVERATEAYLNLLSPEQRARSDAYFEGGYWIGLWDLLYGLAVVGLILFSGVASRLRDRTRWTRFPALNAGFFGVGYTVLTALLTLPWAIYTGFIREHQYHLSTQAFPGWLRDQAVALGVGVVLILVGLTLLYAAFRRFPQRWWVWGAGISIALLAVIMVIGPVFIAPLFNRYQLLPEGTIRTRILSLAHANGIPAQNVYWFNASKQSKRVSANVSGIGPTTRISLNDNLLLRSPEEGVEAVMGHEMGHYVLHHINHFLVVFGLGIVGAFAFVAWGFQRLQTRFGARWGVTGIADPAGWPALTALLAVFSFVTSPIAHAATRTAEIEADYFGLNAARQPDGFAYTAIQLSEYRKLRPGPIEEFLFFDHPSGYQRVHAAMQWKAEHLADYGVQATPR
jgi:STE24 endopeptidase